ncbi:TetR/AcrR family transcriptional regulator [Streptomyces hydrogenans]|uniref:TetR/AcrR family transcriptional regulator n=1 Tax=Streptomyces hydrogenans TaxID=1873719 RepID=UPI0033AD15D7
MPRIADRSEQRRQIGAALLRLAGEEGLDQVSVRTVAAASGRSPGAVQKYFRSKEELLLFASQLSGERIERRMQSVDPTLPLRQALRALVLTILPLDEERRAETAAQLAFAVHAAHHPRLAEVRRRVDREVHEALARRLAAAGTPEPGPTADALIAVSDGLALRLLYAPGDADSLLAALDRAIATLTPP